MYHILLYDYVCDRMLPHLILWLPRYRVFFDTIVLFITEYGCVMSQIHRGYRILRGVDIGV